ncbi:MAG: diguanylate cyclase protein [Rhodocyclaceae bacterium]|nr:diguanylate cyclase protein [Rhodocyclaceae bacterium]
MEKLVGVVQELSLARDLETVMAIVRRAARELTGADGATFVLRDGDQCFYAEENAIEPLWKGKRFPMSICISGWVMLNRQSTVIEDIYADPRIPAAAYRPTFVRSLAMVPIRTLDPLGAIGNYWAKPYRPSPEQLKVLQALADTTAVAMENVKIYAELEERVRQRTAELEGANGQLRREIGEREKAEAEIRRLSLTDELTGLYNRRGFFLLAEQELRLVRRSSPLAWLLFADVDGLKRVNDEQGHEAGDQLITDAAEVLRASFRDSDIISRLGGDEFVAFGLGSPEQLAELQGRLRETIARFNRLRRRNGPLSLSIGTVAIDPGSSASLDEWLAQADAAMYAEKRARHGRHREAGQAALQH